MASTRLKLVSSIIILNAFFVLYLCISWNGGPQNISSKLSRPSQYLRLLERYGGRNGNSIKENALLDKKLVISNSAIYSSSPSDSSVGEKIVASNNNEKERLREGAGIPENNGANVNGRDPRMVVKKGKDTAVVVRVLSSNEFPAAKDDPSFDPSAGLEGPSSTKSEDLPVQEPPRRVQKSEGVLGQLVAAALDSDDPDPPLDSLERKMYAELRDCPTRSQAPLRRQQGHYRVLENYIPAALSFRCDESITYTTHGDYTFLDNLETLTFRWQGPVSIGVYAPGSDFEATVNSILYLRNCWAGEIKKYVTFHLIYHRDHVPKKVPSTEELVQRKTDCRVDHPKWQNVTTYRQQKKLLYPINIARNVARRTATTYFVFPSDVELYPSVNFIPEFFKMLKRPDFTNTTVPKVFVFSIFEVKENVPLPATKAELLTMLEKGDAIPFHQNVCAHCHNVPHSKEWLSTPIKPGLSVVHSAKRLGEFKRWEPIFVGTHRDPQYDKRLSWEGKRDKMTQMYILCMRDYEFHVLDNAFLVHRPGIKYATKDPARDMVIASQKSLIMERILPEYTELFGTKSECVV